MISSSFLHSLDISLNILNWLKNMGVWSLSFLILLPLLTAIKKFTVVHNQLNVGRFSSSLKMKSTQKVFSSPKHKTALCLYKVSVFENTCRNPQIHGVPFRFCRFCSLVFSETILCKDLRYPSTVVGDDSVMMSRVSSIGSSENRRFLIALCSDEVEGDDLGESSVPMAVSEKTSSEDLVRLESSLESGISSRGSITTEHSFRNGKSLSVKLTESLIVRSVFLLFRNFSSRTVPCSF